MGNSTNPKRSAVKAKTMAQLSPRSSCPQCGAPVRADQRFCPICGASTDVEASSPTLFVPGQQPDSQNTVIPPPPPPPGWDVQQTQQSSPPPSSPQPASTRRSSSPSTPYKWKLWIPLAGLLLIILGSIVVYSTHPFAPAGSSQSGTPGAVQPGQMSTPSPTLPFTPTSIPSPTPSVSPTSPVQISDASHVLNAPQVQAEGAKLPYPLDIYTTNTFTGTSTEFDQRTGSLVTSPRLIVIAIDTFHRHLAIVGGSSVRLTNSQYSQAVNAFRNNFYNGDYTGATIAAIRSLRSSLGATA